MAKFIRVAHRGASGNFPEHTRLAFEKAIEARADMIELDCQLSSDGHVIVYHDERLRRTTGTRGAVKEKTLAQLKKLDAGKWRKKSFEGQQILTLEEVMDCIHGRVDLCLDIKQYAGSLRGIELKLLFILSHYDYLERTVFSTFDYESLRRLRELAPDARLGVIFDSKIKEDPFAVAEQVAAASIHVRKELASRDFLDKAWNAGMDVFVWTVNEVREMEKFASVGVQGIVSDFPERFWKLKAR
jgi:glycerophosphoryl diester phosphodiesterase